MDTRNSFDLIVVGDRRADDDFLRLPHPRAHERAFVLRPWLAVDPAATLRTGEGSTPVRDLIPSVADQDVHPLEPR